VNNIPVKELSKLGVLVFNAPGANANAVKELVVAGLLIAARNLALDAEVRDLKVGLDAIEERARSELGMIKRDEIFFQILDERPTAKPSPP